MNTGTTAAREAGNMVDLDGDEAHRSGAIGKQLLNTRGAAHDLLVANDVSTGRSFRRVHGHVSTAREAQHHTSDARRAVLAAVIFNIDHRRAGAACSRGVKSTPGAAQCCVEPVIYGTAADRPFPCIWAIDRILGWLHLA
jgi:high-affinity K+ transport system ATPase subunit B